MLNMECDPCKNFPGESDDIFLVSGFITDYSGLTKTGSSNLSLRLISQWWKGKGRLFIHGGLNDERTI